MKKKNQTFSKKKKSLARNKIDRKKNTLTGEIYLHNPYRKRKTKIKKEKKGDSFRVIL